MLLMMMRVPRAEAGFPHNLINLADGILPRSETTTTPYNMTRDSFIIGALPIAAVLTVAGDSTRNVRMRSRRRTIDRRINPLLHASHG